MAPHLSEVRSTTTQPFHNMLHPGLKTPELPGLTYIMSRTGFRKHRSPPPTLPPFIREILVISMDQPRALPTVNLPSNTNAPFRFLDLPLDVRYMTYKALPVSTFHHRVSLGDRRPSVNQRSYPSDTVTFVTRGVPTQLLATCRVIYEEAKTVIERKLQGIGVHVPRMILDGETVPWLFRSTDSYEVGMLTAVFEWAQHIHNTQNKDFQAWIQRQNSFPDMEIALPLGPRSIREFAVAMKFILQVGIVLSMLHDNACAQPGFVSGHFHLLYVAVQNDVGLRYIIKDGFRWTDLEPPRQFLCAHDSKIFLGRGIRYSGSSSGTIQTDKRFETKDEVSQVLGADTHLIQLETRNGLRKRRSKVSHS